MTPLRTKLALLLLAGAVLLAAGCSGEQKPIPISTPVLLSNSTVTTVSPEEQRPIPEGKYLFVKHFVNTGWMTIEGNCDSIVPSDSPLYFLDERTGNLSIRLCPEDQINTSLLMFYGGGWSADPVYSLPRHNWDGVTVTQVNSSGFVFLTYQNTSIVLKPDEHLVFNRSWIQKTTEGRNGQICTKKIVTTDNFSNEGFFDTEKIHVSYHEKCYPGTPLTRVI